MLEPTPSDAPGRPGQGLADLRALAQVILEISRSLDLDHVLQASLGGIQRVVGGDAGCFVLLQPDAQTFRLSHVTNLPPSLHEQLEQVMLDPDLASTKRGEYRPQVISSIGHLLAEILRRQMIASFVLIPLTALGDPVGVLLVLTRGSKLLEPGSVDLLMSIGEQVGMAIENARLHAALKESESWHRAFIENSPDGFWEGDFQGRITYVNDAACQIVEMSREELIGLRSIDFVVDPDAASVVNQTLLREGFLPNHVLAIGLKNGKEKTISTTTRLVRDGAGAPARFQSIFHDVTQAQQLLEKLSRRNQELNALNAIATILSHPLELEQSFDQVCGQMVSITGMDSAALCLVDPSQTALCLLASRGISEALLNQVRRLGLDDPITRRIAVEGKIVAVNDVASYEVPGFAGPRAEGYHAGICMPIKQHGAVIGVIFVGSKSQTAYEQSDVDLLQNISNQLGTALENAELYCQMQRRVEELDGLAQLSAACSASLDPAVLADLATAWTRRLLPSDLCTLRLIESDALTLRSNSAARPAALPEDVQFDSLFRDLAEKRSPYIVEDAEVDSTLPAWHKAGFRQIGMRAALAVPLPVPDRVIGFLMSARASPHVWLPREIELLQTIGNQTANAIHNANLFQNVLSEQRKVQAIFDSGLSGLYATNAAGRIVMFNRAAERITGWSISGVLGREWGEVFADPEPLIAKALAQKDTAYYPDGRTLTARDGRVIPVAEAVAPLFDEKGQVNGAVGAFWDLTKEQLAERSREHFLTMVAHQLRSPLTGMLSALQLLQRRNLSSQQRTELWSVVKGDGERLRTFADEFLGLESTVQSPRPIQMEPISIAAVARNLVHKFGAEHRGHRFRVKSSKPEPVVFADLWRVENILDNLLDNAVTYSPSRSTVDVSIKALGKDIVQVTVEDEGEGVPVDDRARVFEPFYRSARLSSRNAYGHGLGLSIAQSMVKQMGGEIWVDAGKDHGSAFRFTLRRHE